MFKDPIINILGEWSGVICPASIIMRIALSMALSAIVGCERSSKRHSAGLRTFVLMSLASTVAMLLDSVLSENGAKLHIISAAVMTAVAIISMNSTLFTSRNQIKGLTTSVGLWACSVIGLAIGAGLYTVTLVSFIALMCTLALFPSFEAYLKNRSNHFEVHLELTNSMYLQNFVTTIRRLGLRIDDIELNPAYANSGLSVYTVAVSINSEELKKYKTHTEITEALSTLEYVCHIEEMHT